jgi:hypothetical protein
MCLALAKLLLLCAGSPGLLTYPLNLTARQYGEVVLPDAIPVKAGSLNRVVIYHWPEKEGMAHFLPSGYKFY